MKLAVSQTKSCLVIAVQLIVESVFYSVTIYKNIRAVYNCVGLYYITSAFSTLIVKNPLLCFERNC